MKEIKIKCNYEALVPLNELKPNPKNPAIHSLEQIKRIAKNIQSLGIRKPIEVSKLSGYIVCGHGRRIAFEKLKVPMVPIVYQEFDSPEEEYTYMVSDNTLQSEWFEIDKALVNAELENLGPDFDLELLGFEEFKVDVADFEPVGIEEQSKLDEKQLTKCPSCGEIFDHAKHKA